MRRSREVHLTLLASLALSLTACKDAPQHCVDAQNRLLPDSACHTGSTGYVGAHFVYGGSSGGNIGDTVVGASVTRGGFGGFFGGGEGGDE
jgi:hypothetical protein